MGKKEETVDLDAVLAEETLLAAPPDVKGAWLWILFMMWKRDTHIVQMCAEDLGRLWGCTPVEAKALAEEIRTRRIGNVTFCNGLIAFVNRRRERDQNQRAANALRVRQFRERQATGGAGNAPVTRSKPRLYVRELAMQMEAKRRQCDRLYARFGLEHKAGRTEHPQEWDRVQALRREIEEIDEQIASGGQHE